MFSAESTERLLPRVQRERDSANAVYTVDEALAHIGSGPFQFVLLVILGLSWFADATEILLMAFLGPDVKCDWDLSDAEVSAIGTVVFVGMGIGGYIWGCVSNVFGRKPAAILSVAFVAVAGIVSAFAKNYWMLVVSRAIVGLGLGGATLVYTMYSEFLPVKHRGTKLCTYQMLWAFGSVTAASMAWITMPTFRWHGLLLVSVVPAVILLILLPFVPESPRYLVVIGKEQQAAEILALIARVNKSSMPQGQLRRNGEQESETRWTKFKRQFHSLFEHPLNYITPLLWIMFFSAGFSYYCIVILSTSIHTNDDEDDDSCVDDHVDLSSADYLDVLYSSLVEFPAYLVGAFSLEYFGRLLSLKIGWWSCAFFMFLILILDHHDSLLLIFARLTVSFLFMVIYAYGLEIYPSSCRPFGMGMLVIVSRVGAAIAPFIAQSLYHACGLEVVAAIIGTFLVVAGFAVFLFPYDTTGGSMVESTKEVARAFDSKLDLHNCLANVVTQR